MLKTGRAIGMVAAAAVISAAFSAPSAEAVETLKFSSFAPDKGHTVRIMKPFFKKVTAAAGGDVKFADFWGGALGRGPVVQLKLMLDGVSDIGFINPAYSRGRFKYLDLFNLPYVVNGAEEAAFATWKLYEAGMLPGFQGIRPLALYSASLSHLHLDKPIKSLAEVKGLKLRATGKGQVQIARILGAVPISMPVTKMAESISRGVVSGSLFDWVGYFTFKLARVAPYHNHINLGVIPLTIMMNEKAYQRLSAKGKAAVDANSGLGMSITAGKIFDSMRGGLIKKYEKAKGHIFVNPSAADEAANIVRFKPLHDAWRKQSPEHEKVFVFVMKTLAELRDK